MKKFLVMCAALISLIACDKDEKVTSTDVVATDVVSDIDAVDVAEDVSAVDVATVATPDASTATDASVGD
jgi:hypothetical protein